MNIGKCKNNFRIALVFLLFAVSLSLKAQDRTVFIRVLCDGDNVKDVCTDKARDAAEEKIVEEMNGRRLHFFFKKASLDLNRDLCGVIEITVSRFQSNSTWTAAIAIYKSLRTCTGRPDPNPDDSPPLPMLDVKDRISNFPTYLQFAQGVRGAMNQYITLNRGSIEKMLWKRIPLGFGAQLKNQDGKFEAAVVVKYYKKLEEAPQIFATALYSLKDLNSAHGSLFFRLAGRGCVPQQNPAPGEADELQVKAEPIQVIEPAADPRKYAQDDSAIFQTMTDNVIYMFEMGSDGECVNGTVPPSGFNPRGTAVTTTASAR